MRRQIALLTDFGTRDPYVAAMKGVIAARTGAPIHDLGHEIPPHDVIGAAWFLRNVAAYWPAGTIFVCVVDPGVGTARRIVAVETNEKVFLAPDNGLLTFVLEETEGARVRAVTNEALFLRDGSNTFHGRDRFAPVAAALAEGTPLEELGPEASSLVRLDYQPARYGADEVSGSIVAIDRFGNAVTDIERRRIPFDRFVLRTGRVSISRLVENYEEGGDEPFLIVGSTGCLEISMRQRSAAEWLQLSVLDHLELRPQTV